jgi:hypothetical protein
MSRSLIFDLFCHGKHSECLLHMDFLSTWFVFDRSQRLLLGFESPIHAGIFIAAIIPWIRWASWPPGNRFGKSCIIASLAVELALLYLLSRTGSRGPMLALLVAYVIEIALYFRAKDYRHAKLLLLRSGIAAAALALFITTSGFGGRFAEAVAFTDGSIQNRLEILKHARPLLLLDPANGVGWGWSGHHYSQWFEPQHLRYLYNVLSNEYLQIGTELGLPLFFIILTCICMVLASPWFQSTRQSGIRAILMHKAYCSFVIFAAVSWTTSYRYSVTLVMMTLPVFAMCACLTRPFLNWRALVAGIAGALCVIAVFLSLPSPAANVRAVMRNDNMVELQHAPATQTHVSTVLVFVDKDILGQVYGQTLRIMLGHPPFNGKMFVVLPFAKSTTGYHGATDACIAFGSSIASPPMVNLPSLRQLTIVHPSIRPPEKLPSAGSIRVILPSIDEAGVNESWLRFCRTRNIPVNITPDCGLDIQHRAETFFATHD